MVLRRIILFILIANLISSTAFSQNTAYIRYQEPQLPTFDELISLSKNPNPTGKLSEKIQQLWTTPFISNEAYYEGAKNKIKQSSKLGPFFRVSTWNIEKSLHFKDAIKLFKSKSNFSTLLNTENLSKEDLHHLFRQRDKIASSDILVLQEMDYGVKRSQYLYAAKELAQSLNMNYAYAVAQLEIDPAVLGTEKILSEDGQIDQEAMDFYAATPELYKGLFGSAILSKWPIKNVETFQLKTICYDWYTEEKEKITYLEKARRLGTKLIFINEVTREMKVGGRIFFRADLDVPEISGGTLTIINVHMEIKCQPECRERQMLEILSYIKDIKNPVIMLGDFNAAPTDISPTSITRTVKRTVKNPTNWLSLGIRAVAPEALLINATRAASTVTKNFQDPLASNIKIVAPNPLKGLFTMIEDYRFSDGGAFDFRGDAERSVGNKNETLANSNQRDFKGFVTSFQLRRPIAGILGKYRLDWLFVKSELKNSRDYNGPYKLAPHFGETLELMNARLIQPISDHHPSVIDIPFDEPVSIKR
jgi:endonuclease/exonuclease/phosphatase family metal-dependent hydrolase